MQLMARWIVRSIPHGRPIELFLIPVNPHNWYNKGHGMCYPACGMVHINE